MDSIIRLEEIEKSYFMGAQAIKVLKGISLEIFKNEYVALMGPCRVVKNSYKTVLELLAAMKAGQQLKRARFAIFYE